MNIGVLGYYGYGNVGDETILGVMREFLRPHNVIPIQTGFSADKESIERLNGFDFLILGGGGLFNDSPTSPFDTFDQWRKHLKPPIGILGIGVKKIDPSYSDSIYSLVEHSRFFIVRDKESHSLLSHPKVQLAPDLTFYKPQQVDPYPILSRSQVTCGVNLRPSRTGINDWIRSIISLRCSRRAIPFSVVPSFDDREPLSLLDVACPREFDLRSYFGLDIFIGVAFHSIVFAIQNGIPSLAVDYHPKVRRLMQDIDLNEYSLDWDKPEYLEKSYWRLLDNHRLVREKMLDYTSKSHSEVVEKLSFVKKEIDTHYKSAASVPAEKRQYPRATVIINCANPGLPLMETIQACVSQDMQDDLDIIVSVSSHTSDLKLPDFFGQRISGIIINDDNSDWVMNALKNAKGEYITWLNAGDGLARDALRVMLGLALENKETGLVYSDSYLTKDKVIERKANPRLNPFERYLGPYGPSFLVHCHYAVELRNLQLEAKNSEKTRKINQIYIAQGLLFRPARETEIALYRSAIAFGYGKIEAGRQHLESAIQGVFQQQDQRAELEKIFNFFWNTPFEINYYIPNDSFMELVYRNFPGGNRRVRRLRKIFRARTLVARAFRLIAPATANSARRLLLDAVFQDPTWLLNRGVLSLLMRSILPRSSTR
jgi:Uncharacterized conserved protein